MVDLLNPSTYKKYLTPTNILIVVGGLGLLYYSTVSGNNDNKKNIDVEYTVTPLKLDPGNPGSVTIEGAFTDQVDNAYFYVTDSNLIPITHGNLGTNVTTFKKSIMLPPLVNGKYNVTVTNEEIKP